MPIFISETGANGSKRLLRRDENDRGASTFSKVSAEESGTLDGRGIDVARDVCVPRVNNIYPDIGPFKPCNTYKRGVVRNSPEITARPFDKSDRRSLYDRLCFVSGLD